MIIRLSVISPVSFRRGRNLQRSLTDKSYQMGIEHTAVKGGILLRHHGSAYPESAQLTTAGTTVRFSDPVYTGRLMLLVDRGYMRLRGFRHAV